MFSPETNRKKGKKDPMAHDGSKINQQSNNFSNLSTRPISAAALRRGEWSRSGSDSGIPGVDIQDSVGSIDGRHNYRHPHHLTSTPLRSIAANRSKILRPSQHKMYSLATTPMTNKPEVKMGTPIPSEKKISQESDCPSFADSGIACERSDSVFGNEIVGDAFGRDAPQTQSHFQTMSQVARMQPLNRQMTGNQILGKSFFPMELEYPSLLQAYSSWALLRVNTFYVGMVAISLTYLLLLNEAG
jgi:hypothetical protein